MNSQGAKFSGGHIHICLVVADLAQRRCMIRLNCDRWLLKPEL
jgi:hypothetical protein